jgi:hypothetical protein
MATSGAWAPRFHIWRTCWWWRDLVLEEGGDDTQAIAALQELR